jgi:hypothetical protein
MDRQDELGFACERLLTDAGSRKVLVCAVDGQVLAHAGGPGALDERTLDGVAELLGGILDGLPEVSGDQLVALEGGTKAFATLLENRAVLLVLFSTATTLERVRAKVRRLGPEILSHLPSERGSTERNPISS